MSNELVSNGTTAAAAAPLAEEPDFVPVSITGVFRSEQMLLCHLFFQSNIAFDATCELGELGIVEFRELNHDLNSYQRKFVDEIRRIESIQVKLDYLQKEILNEKIEIQQPKTDPHIPRFKEILRMETSIEELEKNLRDLNGHLDSLKTRQLEYDERNEMLLKTHRSLEGNLQSLRKSSMFGESSTQDDHEITIVKTNQYSDKLHTISGIVRADKYSSFHTMLWRICGNNALVQFFDIEQPMEDLTSGGELVQKKIFLIFCQGNQLAAKAQKICTAFHATVYRMPADSAEHRDMCNHVDTNLKELKLVIDQTMKQKFRILMAVATAENLQTWTIQIAKLKAVFSCMNLYRKTEKGFIAECWVARTDFNRLQRRVDQVAIRSGVTGQAVVEIIATPETPPTYFRTNKFTQAFQNIVESYGVADYREMNPAPFTIITFPFMFALMFADAGHGMIMFLFALWMVLYERRLAGKSNNEIWLMMFGGRYIILLMGLFSMYNGLMYNDVFAKSVNVFGTAFNPPEIGNLTYWVNGTKQVSPGFPASKYLLKDADSVYPFGVDPAWQLSENKILFLNSFKMKLSVILGIAQMTFGVFLSLLNHIHFRRIVSILFEFIPQIVFLMALFGYMITLIFTKWLMIFNDPSHAPSILIDFINMFLMKYPNEPDTPPYLKPWFQHKQFIQTILLAIALICVPIMLLVKPTITVCTRKRKNDYEKDEENPSTSHDGGGGGGHDGENDTVGDIYIYQAIHTIEYCLGAISHTASYLRLWALSLAHTQLSEVLWNMVMKAGFASGGNHIIGSIMTYATFGGWAILTVVILIVMEGLSAFLHALRLHWVEFQSKFYVGSGYLFKPFRLSNILANSDD